jgi:hypothetical protein
MRSEGSVFQWGEQPGGGGTKRGEHNDGETDPG